MKGMIALVIGAAFVMVSGSTFAAGGKVTSPTGVAPDRYAYYPGTEELGPDEMRVVACGTGMPDARRLQAFDHGDPEGRHPRGVVPVGADADPGVAGLVVHVEDGSQVQPHAEARELLEQSRAAGGGR